MPSSRTLLRNNRDLANQSAWTGLAATHSSRRNALRRALSPSSVSTAADRHAFTQRMNLRSTSRSTRRPPNFG